MPMIVYGTASRSTDLPRAPGSDPSLVTQNAWLMTATLFRPGWSSSGEKVRPCTACTPSDGKRDAVASDMLTRLACPLLVLKLAPFPVLYAANAEKERSLLSINSRYSGSEIQLRGIPSFFSAPHIFTSCCGAE